MSGSTLLVLILHNVFPVPSSPPPDNASQPPSPVRSLLSEGRSYGPPSKRRRVSYSSGSSSLSGSDSSSSEDEEEKPLAAKVLRGGRGKKGGPRQQGTRTGGKGMPGKKSKAQTAPAHIAPPTEEERAEMVSQPTNGANGHPVVVKVEDKMDESQLTRLVTGVTVDASGAPSAHVRCFVLPCL